MLPVSSRGIPTTPGCRPMRPHGAALQASFQKIAQNTYMNHCRQALYMNSTPEPPGPPGLNKIDSLRGVEDLAGTLNNGSSMVLSD